MYETSIAAEVLHITNPQDRLGSLATAQRVLTGEPFLPRLLPPDKSGFPGTANELSTDMCTVIEAINGQPFTNASTFTQWPYYQRMMHTYGERANGNATALMIGSLTPLSSRSFVCLAQTEYGADKHFIVDPSSSRYKARHGNFAFGSGLALPIASESIDFVHVNQLLHSLFDPRSPSRPPAQCVLRLCAEIGRVLAPGGQLLMKELPLDYAPGQSQVFHIKASQYLEQLVTKALKKFGLKDVHVEPPGVVTRDSRFVFNTNRDFTRWPVIGHDIASRSIYARKPKRQMHALGGIMPLPAAPTR
ncbi:MAG TPA: hypothetical protein VLI54_04905 [Bacillota bacterium]|nr:hypothetical protein [Bacillota bacterium]